MAEFVRLRQMNARQEGIGLFDQAKSLKPLADQIEALSEITTTCAAG